MKKAIVINGSFKGVIGELFKITSSLYEEPKCDIRVDRDNVITVGFNQIKLLKPGDNVMDKRIIGEVITDINVVVPDKVVVVTFSDYKKEKMVCHEEDAFNLRNCLFIAIAKHLYKEDYTVEGIEWKAKELMHMKKYVKIVDSALKCYKKKQKDIKLLEESHRLEQERIERKRAKRQAYKERRAIMREQIEKEKQIEIQKEAYIQAMNEFHDGVK